MKTLGEILTPRQTVFDQSYKDVVLDLTDLNEDKIDPDRFFAENYITKGMEQLYQSVFKRMEGTMDDGVFKLTQAMGGGKTHTMIAVGLLAKYPEYRKPVMSEIYDTSFRGAAKVVAFSGREKPKNGIWTFIAESIGKKDVFQELNREGEPPGQSDWIRLLQGEPTLILLDELPDYLNYAATVSSGLGTLADKTARALTTLLNALGKEELSNVALVISDLQNAYAKGSGQIDELLGNFEKETRRLAKNFTPVRQNTNEIYHILRKRLFKEEVEEEVIQETAAAYGKALDQVVKMELTNESPRQLEAAIRESYPFHPFMRELYARFKENPGFMQTRGLIRLMRAITARMFDPQSGWAKESYLIHPYDIDANDDSVSAQLNEINNKLINAVSNDIASGGNAAAEKIDEELGSSLPTKTAKLIFMSSLSMVQGGLKGLKLTEIYASLATPGIDISQLKNAILPALRERSWYLHADKNGALLYKDVANVSAKINTYRKGYNPEAIRKEMKAQMKELFEPKMKDLYQQLYILPALDEIEVDKDKIALVIFQPYAQGGLQPEMQEWYENLRYKNRVFFLTGDQQSIDSVFENARSIRAAEDVKAEFDSEKVPTNDPQYQEIEQLIETYRFRFYSATTNVFTKLIFPTRRGLMDTNINLQFEKNKLEGEEQIRQTMIEKRKFTTETEKEAFLKQLEQKLFEGNKERPWGEIIDAAATNTSWLWHKPNALSQTRREQVSKDHWREDGNWIKIGPFPKPPTDVRIQEMGRDEKTGKMRLRIQPVRGSVVHYAYGKKVSDNDPVWDPKKDLETDELYVAFLCVDPEGTHETGDTKVWQNTIDLKYEFYPQGDVFRVEFKVAPRNAEIFYSTDGSEPIEYGGTYADPFEAKPKTKILAVAKKEELESKRIEFDLPDIGASAELEINPVTPLTYKKRSEMTTTAETFHLINLLKRFEIEGFGLAVNVDGDQWLSMEVDERVSYKAEQIEEAVNFVWDKLLHTGELSLALSRLKFSTGQHFLDFAREATLEYKPQDIEQRNE